MIQKPKLRDNVISLKLTDDERHILSAYSARYGLPSSTVAYLIVKDALVQFETTHRLGVNLELL